VRGLTEKLKDLGREVVSTFEPGGTAVARSVRSIFTEPPGGEVLDKRTELLLVCAARAQHVEQLIRPAMVSGKVVLCDRYSDSTRVYQGDLGKNEIGHLEDMIAFAEAGVRPELTFLLDAPVELLEGRLSKRGGKQSRFDLAAKPVHENIRSSFLEIAKNFPDRIVVLDATSDPLVIVEKALAVIARHLGEA